MSVMESQQFQLFTFVQQDSVTSDDICPGMPLCIGIFSIFLMLENNNPCFTKAFCRLQCSSSQNKPLIVLNDVYQKNSFKVLWPTAGWAACELDINLLTKSSGFKEAGDRICFCLGWRESCFTLHITCYY